jgi:putative hydrolase of the HAD superfamily
MIQAIIFDCFGVLTTDGWLPFKRRNFGTSGESFEEATSLNHQVDSGLISYADFIRGVADLAGVPFAEAKKQIEDNVPNAPLFELIKELKPKYKIGFLSNAGGNWLNELFTDEQANMFDAVSISFETGHMKQEEQAYASITDKLGVFPEECVFVDDQPRYCAAARDIGMKAIEYKNFEQFREDLTALLDRS